MSDLKRGTIGNHLSITGRTQIQRTPTPATRTAGPDNKDAEDNKKNHPRWPAVSIDMAGNLDGAQNKHPANGTSAG